MTRTTLDRFEDRYAHRTSGMRSSAMRDLMAITTRAEIISLAGGLPDTSGIGSELVADIVRRLERDGRLAAAFQYGPTEGMDELRELACHVMSVEGIDVDPEHIIVTAGGQQVLDLVARTFVNPGDIVLAEGPTYPGVVPVFSSYQADVVQIDLDEQGLDPDRVADALDNLKRQRRRPKYLYTIPSFQNPAGVTMTRERRERLVQLAAERDLLVLEDNPYSMLRFEGEPVPTLRSLDPAGNVMYLGTFSKIFAPGVRLGWLEAPPPILARVNLAKQAADLCSSSLSQHIVREFFQTTDWRAYVAMLTDRYRSRRDAMLAALAEHFPDGAHWTQPHGGLFIWVTLPGYIDTQDLLARALRANVAFVPGQGAYMDGRGVNSMRLNFSAVDEQTIEEGVRRLGSVIFDVMQLAERMGVGPEPHVHPHPHPKPVVDDPAPTEDSQEQLMRIVVLHGGRSFERAVSLRSGRRVAEALRRQGHDVELEDVGPHTARRLLDEQWDCAFIALHGSGGEDGSIQELLDLMGVAYTGSGAAASARAADKVDAKRTLQAAGVPTPAFASITAAALQDLGAAQALERAVDTLGLPLVVKPASGGSALGIRFVGEPEQLARAVMTALSYDRHVLLERYITGRELSVSILGGGDELQCLPAVHIKPRRADYYDFESRYTPGETEFACPPQEASADELDRVRDTAAEAYRRLGLDGFGRVDLVLDDAGVPWVLECNSIPGLTETSLLPMAAREAGIDFDALVERIVTRAAAVAV